jgi:hypothetical protein
VPLLHLHQQLPVLDLLVLIILFLQEKMLYIHQLRLQLLDLHLLLHPLLLNNLLDLDRILVMCKFLML